MSESTGERLAVGGLVAVAVILALSLLIDLALIVRADEGWPSEDIVGVTATGTAFLAVVGVLGSYLSRKASDE